jgi:hypothetical protein
MAGFWLGLALFAATASAAPFSAKEKLQYNIYWFVFLAGEASLEVGERFVIDNTDYIKFAARAQSRILFFFKVDDRIESVCLANDLWPVRFDKHLREGKYKKDQVVFFDLAAGIARYDNNKEAPLAANCRDVLGLFYYFRGLNLPDNGEFTLCAHADKKNYPLLIQVLKREKVKVEAGEFSAVKIILKPHPDFEGLFRNKGDIWIWFTDDSRKIPIKIKAEVPILGSVNIELRSID